MVKDAMAKDPAPRVQGFNPQGEAAPGLENIVLAEGAWDGVGCHPSPDKAQAPVGDGVRYYADIHRTRKNIERYRITYSVDGVSFKHVDDFEDIPAKAGDKIYIDTIPLNYTNGAIKLLRQGIELYCLRRTTLIEKRREELGLPKTTRNDIRILMSLEERWFRKLSEDFLIMRRMISAYRGMLRTHQRLLNIKKASGIDFEHMINSLENAMDEMAKQIVEEASKRYQAYNRLIGLLRIGGKVSAMEALAELVVYLDPTKGFRKTANLLGLFRSIRGKRKLYNRCLRQALQRLTSSANNIIPQQLTAKLEKDTLRKIWKTYRQETQGRAAIPAQG
jgi:hypothetical protein